MSPSTPKSLSLLLEVRYTTAMSEETLPGGYTDGAVRIGGVVRQPGRENRDQVIPYPLDQRFPRPRTPKADPARVDGRRRPATPSTQDQGAELLDRPPGELADRRHTVALVAGARRWGVCWLVLPGVPAVCARRMIAVAKLTREDLDLTPAAGVTWPAAISQGSHLIQVNARFAAEWDV
jgi:hypothetical protein